MTAGQTGLRLRVPLIATIFILFGVGYAIDYNSESELPQSQNSNDHDSQGWAKVQRKMLTSSAP